MKIIIFYLAFFLLFTYSITLHSQDDIKNYKQPEVSEGSNLILKSSPSYDNEKEKLENYIYKSLHINMGASFIKWKFTPKFNYTIIVSSNAYIDKSTRTSDLITEDKTTETFTNTNFLASLVGGASYYLIKDKFYSGIYIKFF